MASSGTNCESRGRHTPSISKDHLSAQIGEFNREGAPKSSVRLDCKDGVNGLKADVLSGKKRTVQSRWSIGACEKKTFERDFELVRVTQPPPASVRIAGVNGNRRRSKRVFGIVGDGVRV